MSPCLQERLATRRPDSQIAGNLDLRRLGFSQPEQFSTFLGRDRSVVLQIRLDHFRVANRMEPASFGIGSLARQILGDAFRQMESRGQRMAPALQYSRSRQGQLIPAGL